VRRATLICAGPNVSRYVPESQVVRYPSAIMVVWLFATSAALAAGNMRAIVFSGGDFQLQSVPKPEPQAGQVRIKVRAASVNPVDWKETSRAAPGTRVIPGRDLSGVIDAVGDAAGPWKVGQAVIAIATGGSYAEYAIASTNAVAAKPERLSFDEAAGIPVAGETAWRALVTIAGVQPGQRVLIHGGAGGVGSSAVQIAKARGAYVIATASPGHFELLRSLGADEVVDYHSVGFEEKLKDIDVVFNTVDADTGARSVAVVRPGGILVSVFGAAPDAQCEAAKIRCAVTGHATGEMLGSLSALAEQGKFRVHIDQRFPLAEAAKALELSHQGHTGGKIILEVSR
jgi:NADPH:quinone reductase-like Zn-dependent oxidoreductase